MSQPSSNRAALLRQQIADLQRELDERVAALPRHSVKPTQMLRIEELEDSINHLQGELSKLTGPSG